MKRHAFTLIELLIVITVIGILAMMAIGAYGMIRVNMAIDLQADKLVAKMQTLRAQAKTQPLCFGITFNGTAPVVVSAPYKRADRSCDETEITNTFFEWPSDIVIEEMRLDAASEDNVTAWFVPPDGKLFIGNYTSVLDVVIKIQRGTQIRRRQVTMSAASATIQKTQEPQP